jgi:hypothetical protein
VKKKLDGKLNPQDRQDCSSKKFSTFWDALVPYYNAGASCKDFKYVNQSDKTGKRQPLEQRYNISFITEL